MAYIYRPFGCWYSLVNQGMSIIFMSEHTFSKGTRHLALFVLLIFLYQESVSENSILILLIAYTFNILFVLIAVEDNKMYIYVDSV